MPEQGVAMLDVLATEVSAAPAQADVSLAWVNVTVIVAFPAVTLGVRPSSSWTCVVASALASLRSEPHLASSGGSVPLQTVAVWCQFADTFRAVATTPATTVSALATSAAVVPR